MAQLGVPLVILGRPGQLRPPSSAYGVAEAGLIGLEVGTGLQRSAGDEIELGDVTGEPRDGQAVQYQKLGRDGSERFKEALE